MLVPFWGQRLEQSGKTVVLHGIGVALISFVVVFSMLGYWK